MCANYLGSTMDCVESRCSHRVNWRVFVIAREKTRRQNVGVKLLGFVDGLVKMNRVPNRLFKIRGKKNSGFANLGLFRMSVVDEPIAVFKSSLSFVAV
jgi:hypothetical protein